MTEHDDTVEALKHLANYLRVAVDIQERIQKIRGSKQEIPGDARIYQDLQIGGDVAFKLLEAISQDHGVSFEGFRFDDYFPNETDHMRLMWKTRLGFLKHRRKPLTFDDLVDLVHRGAWLDPCPSPPSP